MRKVLWVIHGAEMYGEARAIVSLMQGVRSAGWHAEALSLTEGQCYQKIVAKGFQATCLRIPRSPGLHLADGPVGKFMQFLKLIRHQYPVRQRVLAGIRERRPDVVHFLGKNILPAVGWAASQAGVPCFWEMTAVIGGGVPLDVNRRLYRRILNRFDIQAIANSRYTASTLGEVRRPAQVMYLGADTQQFNNNHPYSVTRRALGIPESAVVFLIVSRIDASKNQAVFLKAVESINDSRLHTILVGDATIDSDRPHLQSIKDSLTVESAGRAHFVGYSSEPEAYIALSDIGVNARRDAEPFGLFVIESMIMGKPVLVHALGGPAETVIDGKVGWHVTEPTVEAIAAGIRRVLSDQQYWHEMGRAAKDRALQMFTLEAQTQRYFEIVEKRLAEKGTLT